MYIILFMLFHRIINFIREKEFLERYPGDEWVDMVGMDNYGDFGRDDKYKVDAGFIN